MRKRWLLICCCLLVATVVQAQFAKPLKKRATYENKPVFSVGVTGCYAANDMIYSTVKKSTIIPVLAPTFGLAVEWNTLNPISVGADVSWVSRGDKEAFSTEFLTSYSTTTFSRVNYDLSLKGVELCVPVTFYFGNNEYLRPYVFVAPRACLWLNGQYRWERNYDDGSSPSMVYEGEVTQAMMRPVDLSAVVGGGICGYLKTNPLQLYVKLDVGYGLSVLSNFSKGEVDEEVLFQGWGDIGNERLGQRRLQNLEARLTIMVPLRKALVDACGFDQKPYRR